MLPASRVKGDLNNRQRSPLLDFLFVIHVVKKRKSRPSKHPENHPRQLLDGLSQQSPLAGGS